MLHYFGEGTIWQVVLMGVVGFLAPWILALVIWMLILPSDACSVAKELCDQIGRRFSKFKK